MFGLRPLGSNFTMVGLNGCSFWFSYETCIAFSREGKVYHSKGDKQPKGKWSNTTRKHLNEVPAADEVLADEAFEKLATEACGG
jgi:hypothetical protein